MEHTPIQTFVVINKYSPDERNIFFPHLYDLCNFFRSTKRLLEVFYCPNWPLKWSLYLQDQIYKIGLTMRYHDCPMLIPLSREIQKEMSVNLKSSHFRKVYCFRQYRFKNLTHKALIYLCLIINYIPVSIEHLIALLISERFQILLTPRMFPVRDIVVRIFAWKAMLNMGWVLSILSC